MRNATEGGNTAGRSGDTAASADGGVVVRRSAGGGTRPQGRMLRGGLVVCTGLLALAGATALGQAPASASAAAGTPGTATPYLPRPTGGQPVGVTSLYMKDTSRPDPWVPTVNARELMVSLWYPARRPGHHRAQYMTPKESELMLKEEEITSVPADVLSRTRVDAYTDARPAGRRHSLPLVVLSPGFKQPRSTLSGLAEDLASHGYVVAAIDHTYENLAETFPDGRVTTCAACGHYDAAFWQKLEQGRAADVSFVLDRLTRERAQVKGAALIDPHRIAMAGHSVGGSSAQAAMVRDKRLLAGVDIDGTTDGALPKGGLGRPFMFFGKPATYTPGTGNEAASWESDWKRLTGWKRWILVTGTVHQSFTDLAALADELGVDAGNDLPGARSLEITRTYVRAFFDRHLRHRHRPLLDGPSKRYPEVRFCDPETRTCE